MQRSQWISVFTGVVAILLGVGYLILVQVLDWRGGEMLPAPVDLSLAVQQIAQTQAIIFLKF